MNVFLRPFGEDKSKVHDDADLAAARKAVMNAGLVTPKRRTKAKATEPSVRTVRTTTGLRRIVSEDAPVRRTPRKFTNMTAEAMLGEVPHAPASVFAVGGPAVQAVEFNERRDGAESGYKSSRSEIAREEAARIHARRFRRERANADAIAEREARRLAEEQEEEEEPELDVEKAKPRGKRHAAASKGKSMFIEDDAPPPLPEKDLPSIEPSRSYLPLLSTGTSSFPTSVSQGSLDHSNSKRYASQPLNYMSDYSTTKVNVPSSTKASKETKSSLAGAAERDNLTPAQFAEMAMADFSTVRTGSTLPDYLSQRPSKTLFEEKPDLKEAGTAAPISQENVDAPKHREPGQGEAEEATESSGDKEVSLLPDVSTVSDAARLKEENVAEVNRKEAELARQEAILARLEAQKAREQAEQVRREAEQIRREAEEARQAAMEAKRLEAKLLEEAKQREEARKAQEISRVEELTRIDNAKRAEETRLAEEARKQAEEARRQAEEIKRQVDEARKADEARRAEEAKKAEEIRKVELVKQQEAKKVAEAKKLEESRKADAEKKAVEAKKLEESKKAEEAKKAAEAKKAEEERSVEAKKAEEAKKVEQEKAAEAKKLEESKKAEEAKKAAEVKKVQEKAAGAKKAEDAKIAQEAKKAQDVKEDQTTRTRSTPGKSAAATSSAAAKDTAPYISPSKSSRMPEYLRVSLSSLVRKPTRSKLSEKTPDSARSPSKFSLTSARSQQSLPKVSPSMSAQTPAATNDKNTPKTIASPAETGPMPPKKDEGLTQSPTPQVSKPTSPMSAVNEPKVLKTDAVSQRAAPQTEAVSPTKDVVSKPVTSQMGAVPPKKDEEPVSPTQPIPKDTSSSAGKPEPVSSKANAVSSPAQPQRVFPKLEIVHVTPKGAPKPASSSTKVTSASNVGPGDKVPLPGTVRKSPSNLSSSMSMPSMSSLPKGEMSSRYGLFIVGDALGKPKLAEPSKKQQEEQQPQAATREPSVASASVNNKELSKSPLVKPETRESLSSGASSASKASPAIPNIELLRLQTASDKHADSKPSGSESEPPTKSAISKPSDRKPVPPVKSDDFERSDVKPVPPFNMDDKKPSESTDRAPSFTSDSKAAPAIPNIDLTKQFTVSTAASSERADGHANESPMLKASESKPVPSVSSPSKFSGPACTEEPLTFSTADSKLAPPISSADLYNLQRRETNSGETSAVPVTRSVTEADLSKSPSVPAYLSNNLVLAKPAAQSDIGEIDARKTPTADSKEAPKSPSAVPLNEESKSNNFARTSSLTETKELEKAPEPFTTSSANPAGKKARSETGTESKAPVPPVKDESPKTEVAKSRVSEAEDKKSTEDKVTESISESKEKGEKTEKASESEAPEGLLKDVKSVTSKVLS
ncbi:hypothetical protein MGL_2736 [Malassezia globosa CBS 7966]|uniref:Uncharacterized protein n=1 Tax=Malassezia globosa (strain ATCC MYA-4612 / CBS 7966) TaxID=425265 RepID=A8Q567_MALGO|nr:uncharacterized protein MGL_2736 [Malassezia globosa CBS 7966]EDP43140.1 hypothetical protein MGL_2736 [Malassezia globosa CBS 7966]